MINEAVTMTKGTVTMIKGTMTITIEAVTMTKGTVTMTKGTMTEFLKLKIRNLRPNNIFEIKKIPPA